MTTIMPEGDSLRKAVQWIYEQRQDKPDQTFARLIESACLKFDLSPKDAIYLDRFFKNSTDSS